MHYYKLLIALLFAFFAYIVYQRAWHPLSRFTGPFWASITDFYNVLDWISGQHPYRLTDLHTRYGPIVRYGPNRLSFTSSDVVKTVFIKGLKTFPKTEFYDTFGNSRMPHVFMHKDPVAHAAHRRLLLKSFSPQAIERYEGIIDSRLARLRSKIRGYRDRGTSFDLKEAIYLFQCDLMSALMYSKDFEIQKTGKKNQMPDDHMLSKSNAILGAYPSLNFLTPLLAILPHPQTGLWRMRNTLSYVFESMRYIRERKNEIAAGMDVDRGDVLTNVLTSIEKSTEGRAWTEMGLCNEVVGFVFAGIHPAAATMDLLFWNLLHNPDTLRRVSVEIKDKFLSLTTDSKALSLSDVECRLPYLRACVKENFRITPAFSMPLARYVTENETVLNGEEIPRGTSVALCNHAFHHNPEVWGPDHNVYDPDRWEQESSKETSKLMMHFGAGGRQCIGKALATSVIYKVVSTLIAEFDLELADPREQEKAESNGFKGQLPPMESVSISDLHGPLRVIAKRRSDTKS